MITRIPRTRAFTMCSYEKGCGSVLRPTLVLRAPGATVPPRSMFRTTELKGYDDPLEACGDADVLVHLRSDERGVSRAVPRVLVPVRKFAVQSSLANDPT